MKTTRKVDKREQHIKKKLTAAILMLLISSIMTVTSTYAWFTLSTAPEITGVSTTVGANGNLEIALATPETWANPTTVTSEAGDYLDYTTWGNVVDLSNAYGLEHIVLYPAQLNFVDAEDPVKVQSTSILKTPKYGEDGRVSELAANVISGIYDATEDGFVTTYEDQNGNNYSVAGVRALGTVSGMSDRELAYKTAQANITNFSEFAAASVRKSWGKNGGVLAALALKYASDGTATVATASEVQTLKLLITDLEETVDYLDKALIYSVDALLASNASGLTDEEYKIAHNTLMEKSVKNGDVTFDSSTNNISVTGVTGSVTSAEFGVLLSKFDVIVDAVNDASSKATALPDGEAGWNAISPIFSGLVDQGFIDVNGYSISEAKENIVGIINDGITINLNSGSGVYYNISEFTDKFSAKVTVPDGTKFGSIPVGGLEPTIVAKNALKPTYLEQAVTAANNAGKPTGGDASRMLTDTYGYAIDFFLRTNAANSNILLSDAVNRIYEGNTNEDTMGGGTYMSFESTDPTFTRDSVIDLMECIKVVFVDGDYNIVAEARLDSAELEVTDEYKMPLKIWETVEVQDTDADGNPKYEQDGVTPVMKKVSRFMDGDQILIEDAEQNTIYKLTAIVYLDGTIVDNSMVANAVNSLAGSLNIQFASSADLKPMDYTELQQTTTEKLNFSLSNISVVGNTVTVTKAPNATSYTYSIDGAAAQELTFTGDTATFNITDSTTTFTVTASATGFTSSSATWTKSE